VHLTELALWVVKSCKLPGMSVQTMYKRLLRAVEDEVYTAILRETPPVISVTGGTWPHLRSSADPNAVHTPLETSIKMRNDCLLAIYHRWAAKNDCGKTIYDNEAKAIYDKDCGFDHWLPEVDDIVQLAITKCNGGPKMKNTIRIAKKSLTYLCEATQRVDLKQAYHDKLLPYCLESDDDADARKRLTDDQIAAFYAHLDVMHENAMRAVHAKAIKPCVDYLVLALHWGDAPGLLQPQRNDMRSFRFQGPQTNTDEDNYIKFAALTNTNPPETLYDRALEVVAVSKVTLVLNKRNKPTRGRSGEPVTYTRMIDLTHNRKLCAFLSAYKPFAEALQGTTEPYLLCSRTGQPMSSSCLSSRCHDLWKRTLEPKLGFNAAGCNIARRAAVDTARRAHGKRKMSQAEIDEETAQCAARGHTRSTAEFRY
jgi:hypothetical protein